MFRTKKRKIAAYLEDKRGSESLSAFDLLLADYLSGRLKRRLSDLSISKTDIHIDWLTDFRCVNIQGRFHSYYLDIQVEPTEFTLAYDEDEPDDPTEYPLISDAQFYETIASLTEKLG